MKEQEEESIEIRIEDEEDELDEEGRRKKGKFLFEKKLKKLTKKLKQN